MKVFQVSDSDFTSCDTLRLLYPLEIDQNEVVLILTESKSVVCSISLTRSTPLYYEYKLEPYEFILIPDYIWLAGSYANPDKRETANDIDIVVRDFPVHKGKVDSIYLLMRKLFGNSGKPIQLLFNPEGPHLAGDNTPIPLYDLVLRPKSSIHKIDYHSYITADCRYIHDFKSFLEQSWKILRPGGLLHLINFLEDKDLDIELYNVLLREGSSLLLQKKADSSGRIEPGYIWVPPKPIAAFYTDTFSPEELWEKWASKHQELTAEPKYNGFRAILEKGDRPLLWTEGYTILDYFDLSQLDSFPHRFILDGDLGIEENGVRIPRIRLMKLMSKSPTFSKDEKVVFTAFDIPYLDKSLVDLPFSQRRKILTEFVSSIPELDGLEIRVSENYPINSIEQLRDIYNKVGKRPGIEGIMVKDGTWPYEEKATDGMSKIKNFVELKVIVLDKQVNKNGTFSYHCGVIADADFLNIVELGGKYYINLGKTMNTTIDANIGDIISTQVEEVIVNDELVWAVSRPFDIDKERDEPYTARQIIDLARRGNILQLKVSQQVPSREDEPTRAEIAAAYWENHWYHIVQDAEKDGKFVIQAHWRGLLEEDIDKDMEELLKSNHSVHFDMRFSAGRYLFGWTVFAGSAGDNRKELKLAQLNRGEISLQAQPKLPQPYEWLLLKDGAVSPPGRVGSTANRWSKFFVLTNGTYNLGYASRSFMELFLDSPLLSGRILIERAEAEGRRFWVLTKPGDQRPMKETTTLEEVYARLKERGHKFFWWYDRLIEIKEGGENAKES